MVNEDILGGIETGVAKEQSIESIMISFFNAGYPREDIEWAAKSFLLNQPKIVAANPAKPKPINPVKTSSENSLQKSKIFSFFRSKFKSSETPFMKKPYVEQNVSKYDQASQFKERILLIGLVLSLILLLAILAGIFVFKEELANFINSLFGK